MIFENREEAGKLLAEKLLPFKEAKNPLIIALPRGGVILGRILAKTFGWPLELFFVRKLGHPLNPEYAVGALTETGLFLQKDIDSSIDLSPIIEQEQQELARRKALYQTTPPLSVENTTVFLVDDGIATGHTALASIAALREQNPRSLIVATPILPLSTLSSIEAVADHVVYLDAPTSFGAIGAYYRNFPQLKDEDVLDALKEVTHG